LRQDLSLQRHGPPLCFCPVGSRAIFTRDRLPPPPPEASHSREAQDVDQAVVYSLGVEEGVQKTKFFFPRSCSRNKRSNRSRSFCTPHWL